MTLFKPLDVAIGLAFLFMLLTFSASAFVEIASTVRNWRAEMLYGAIKNMLRGSTLVSADDVYKNPLVVGLGRDDAAASWVDLFERFGWRPKDMGVQPSYLPAAVFSACVLQRLNAAPPASDLSPEATIDALRKALATPVTNQADPKQDALRSILETTLATQGPSVQAVRLAIEKWYNDTMDRVTGWYKRRTQACLLMIGLVIALGGNVDTIGVALWLWQGDVARQTIVSAATDYVKNNPMLAGPSGKGANKEAAPAAPPALAEFGAQVLATDRELLLLQYPIGWSHVAFHPLWIFQYLIGALITAIAVSMGSSFWFDALQGLIKMRGAGPKPGAR